MQGSHRKLGVGRVDQYADFDLGCGDRLDIDAFFGKRAEHLRGNPGVAPHADTYRRYLGDVGGAAQVQITDAILGFAQDFQRPVKIGALYREGEIGKAAVLGDVLHDHVDIDIGLGQRAEHLRRDPRLVGDLEQGHLGLVPGDRQFH